MKTQEKINNNFVNELAEKNTSASNYIYVIALDRRPDQDIASCIEKATGGKVILMEYLFPEQAAICH